jgi:hypothetical protein
MALPMVTGIRFLIKMSPQLRGAPEKNSSQKGQKG